MILQYGMFLDMDTVAYCQTSVPGRLSGGKSSEWDETTICASSVRLHHQTTNAVSEDNTPKHSRRGVCIHCTPHKVKSSLGHMSSVHGTSRTRLNIEPTDSGSPVWQRKPPWLSRTADNVSSLKPM